MYPAAGLTESSALAPAGYAIQPIDHAGRNAVLTHEVFGYFPYWFRSRWTQLDYGLVSTIAYFSGEVNADGSVGNTHGWPKYTGDPSASADVVNMINTAHAQGVKVVLCFTNFTSAEIDAIIGTPQYRTTFIQQALAIVQGGNGDGVNIDFEGINSSSKNGLTQFMQALADSFHTRIPGSQVSCAPTDYDTRAGDWDLPALYNAVDLFFFQGYGYGWSGSSTARPVGLLPNTSFWGSLNITTLDRLCPGENAGRQGRFLASAALRAPVANCLGRSESGDAGDRHGVLLSRCARVHCHLRATLGAVGAEPVVPLSGGNTVVSGMV